MEHSGIKFEIMRKYLCHINRLSICIIETTEYRNFISLKDVPDDYNDMYVYGIGIIESEFYIDEKYGYTVTGDRNNFTFF